jgi:hypothetical protein
MVKSCSTPATKRKSTEAPSFTVGKRVRKEPAELSYEALAVNVKKWMNERKLQMLTLIANMRELKKSTAEVHLMCLALYATRTSTNMRRAPKQL